MEGPTCQGLMVCPFKPNPWRTPLHLQCRQSLLWSGCLLCQVLISVPHRLPIAWISDLVRRIGYFRDAFKPTSLHTLGFLWLVVLKQFVAPAHRRLLNHVTVLKGWRNPLMNRRKRFPRWQRHLTCRLMRESANTQPCVEVSTGTLRRPFWPSFLWQMTQSGFLIYFWILYIAHMLALSLDVFLNHSHPIPSFVLNEVWYVKTVDDQPRPRQHPRRGKIQDMGREFTHRSICHSLLPSFADDHISEFFRIEPHNTQNIFLHCGHRSRCFSWRKLTGSPRRQKTLSNLWCGVWVPSCGLWLLKLRAILMVDETHHLSIPFPGQKGTPHPQAWFGAW